ncbi:aldo/keto reductase [Salinimicrobium sp. MT39]|uniref:Aldo/keto reductase n=1 Tax=Salinimicrobium profundisediminis TaxID=2994553 RepID=A0A9X3CVZ1_9FLAO|nr:aldo/keto reductase [Salinimicrobium profundisediminis]MCX2837917.1 aldo/keto reductase [Salinimicrobium profundisediminis]
MGKDFSKIGLGTVQFGMPYGISNKNGQTSEREVLQILQLAQESNITLLDSASAYGNAEEILGKYDLSSFQIISKFLPPEGKNHIKDQLCLTLNNLRIDQLYAYLAHRPQDLLEKPERWEELVLLKEKGLVKKIGYSLNSPNELTKLLDIGFQPDLIQVPYNYFDRRFEAILKQISNTCEIHTRSVFMQGLFFMPPDKLNNYFEEIKPLLRELQNSIDNLPGSLLKFVLEKDFIHQVVIGIENSDQLLRNILSLKNAADLPCLNKNISEKILMPSNWPN